MFFLCQRAYALNETFSGSLACAGWLQPAASELVRYVVIFKINMTRSEKWGLHLSWECYQVSHSRLPRRKKDISACQKKFLGPMGPVGPMDPAGRPTHEKLERETTFKRCWLSQPWKLYPCLPRHLSAGPGAFGFP